MLTCRRSTLSVHGARTRSAGRGRLPRDEVLTLTLTALFALGISLILVGVLIGITPCGSVGGLLVGVGGAILVAWVRVHRDDRRT
jgi:hypothetical protein